jgi:hypothetical protein
MNNTMVRRIFIAALMLTLGAAAAFACEMSFTLEGQSCTSMSILPGATVKLLEGQSYKITVEFNEDHRNCKVPADETLFLLNGEKWRSNKETQALLLKSVIEWDTVTNTKNVTVLEFTASVKGEQVIQIVRECSKGGYDEEITFVVE